MAISNERRMTRTYKANICCRRTTSDFCRQSSATVCNIDQNLATEYLDLAQIADEPSDSAGVCKSGRKQSRHGIRFKRFDPGRSFRWRGSNRISAPYFCPGKARQKPRQKAW